MKPLLSTDSPLYLKRLCRELNALPDGFYVMGQRYMRAILNKTVNPFEGTIAYTFHCRTIADNGKPVWDVKPIDSLFIDAYGRDVCASRQGPKGRQVTV